MGISISAESAWLQRTPPKISTGDDFEDIQLDSAVSEEGVPDNCVLVANAFYVDTRRKCPCYNDGAHAVTPPTKDELEDTGEFTSYSNFYGGGC